MNQKKIVVNNKRNKLIKCQIKHSRTLINKRKLPTAKKLFNQKCWKNEKFVWKKNLRVILNRLIHILKISRIKFCEWVAMIIPWMEGLSFWYRLPCKRIHRYLYCIYDRHKILAISDFLGSRRYQLHLFGDSMISLASHSQHYQKHLINRLLLLLLSYP